MRVGIGGCGSGVPGCGSAQVHEGKPMPLPLSLVQEGGRLGVLSVVTRLRPPSAMARPGTLQQLDRRVRALETAFHVGPAVGGGSGTGGVGPAVGGPPVRNLVEQVREELNRNVELITTEMNGRLHSILLQASQATSRMDEITRKNALLVQERQKVFADDLAKARQEHSEFKSELAQVQDLIGTQFEEKMTAIELRLGQVEELRETLEDVASNSELLQIARKFDGLQRKVNALGDTVSGLCGSSAAVGAAHPRRASSRSRPAERLSDSKTAVSELQEKVACLSSNVARMLQDPLVPEDSSMDGRIKHAQVSSDLTKRLRARSVDDYMEKRKLPPLARSPSMSSIRDIQYQ